MLVALPGGMEARLAEAERLVATNRHEEALRELDDLHDDVRHDAELALRYRLAESWSRMYLGDLDMARELVAEAATTVRSPLFDAGHRADVLFRRGCIAFLDGDVAEAISLYTRALETHERAPRPSPRLAACIHEWRSRCHQRQQSLDAARRDAERSLDLATELGDDELQARALFQASLVAERQKQWMLARYLAEQALELSERRNDLQSSARILNNLGGIVFLLGDADEAERLLVRAAETAAAAGSTPDEAQATSSLAQVCLRTGRAPDAYAHACEALALLEDRDDFLYERANAELVAARAQTSLEDAAAADEWLDRAEGSARRLAAPAQRAAVLVARGDLRRACGELDAAADAYRAAAESLQDLHF